MTREEQARLLNAISIGALSTNEVLTQVVLAIPVNDPAPTVKESLTVAQPAPTELEAAVGELLRLLVVEFWGGPISDPTQIAIARVRAAMGRKA